MQKIIKRLNDSLSSGQKNASSRNKGIDKVFMPNILFECEKNEKEIVNNLIKKWANDNGFNLFIITKEREILRAKDNNYSFRLCPTKEQANELNKPNTILLIKNVDDIDIEYRRTIFDFINDLTLFVDSEELFVTNMLFAVATMEQMEKDSFYEMSTCDAKDAFTHVKLNNLLVDLFWEEGKNKKIDQIEDYEEAWKRAFKDFSSRTLVKKVLNAKVDEDKNLINAKVDEDKRNEAKKYIIESFFNYFKDETEDFEKWHAETCNEFMRLYNEAIKNDYQEIKYGKAQKIVNMMFKYLYCYSGAEKLEKKFEHCHLTLDSYTLDWFDEKVRVKLNGGNRPKKGQTNFINKQNITWSNIDKGDESTVYSYLWIQKQIKDYLEKYPYESEDFLNYKENNPFKAEFLIWRDYKNKHFQKEFSKMLKTFKTQLQEKEPNITDEEITKRIIELLTK